MALAFPCRTWRNLSLGWRACRRRAGPAVDRRCGDARTVPEFGFQRALLLHGPIVLNASRKKACCQRPSPAAWWSQVTGIAAGLAGAGPACHRFVRSRMRPGARDHLADIRALDARIKRAGRQIAIRHAADQERPGLRILWQLVDHLDDLAAPVAPLAGEHHQVPYLREDRSALGCADDRYATAAAEFQ